MLLHRDCVCHCSGPNLDTHFASKRLLEDRSGEAPLSIVRNKDGAAKESPVGIEFKVRPSDSRLPLVTLNVPLSEPPKVKRVAAKYLGKSFFF